MGSIDTKTCSNCKQTKPLSAFNRNSNYCRPCSNAKSKLWYQNNKSRAKQTHDDFIADNPTYNAVYYEENKEQFIKWQREWYVTNKDRLKPIRLDYYNTHKQQYLEAVHRRRALIENAGTFTMAEFIALCEACNYICPACHEKAVLTVDHVVPLSKGGSNTIDNIQPLCGKCNRSKRRKTIDYRSSYATI